MPVTSACIRCQAPLDSGARYCQVCGLSVSGEQTAPLPTLLQLLRQATLGEYEIVREIGQGGMATVYLAHEIALDRKVAIKVMSPQFVHGTETIERFKREARTSASLNHPHIIPIYAVRETDRLLFFVMKYIAGRSLDAVLRDVGPLPFPMVRSILSDVGTALDYAHRQGVIHRDVKPGNIMIDEEGFAVVTDFGIAKAAEGDALTRSGTTVGTPSYLSPEACSGEMVGPAADQYSLGIVGYEMITGTLPFSAESSLGMMYAQVHATPRPSDQLRPDCPVELRDTVMQMLQKSPHERFVTMRDAVQALSGGTGRSSGSTTASDEHLRSHIGLLATPRPSRPVAEVRRTPSSPISLAHIPPGPRTLRRRRYVHLARIGGGLLLAAAGALAAVLVLRQSPEPAVVPDSTPQVPAPGSSADSLLFAERGAATYARQRAEAGGASPEALAAGDMLVARAESLAALGQKTEATLMLSRATALWGAAERPAPTPSQRPPASPGVAQTPLPGVPPRTGAEPAPRPPVTADSVPPSDSLVVAGFYAELERAIESRQVGEIRRLLPNMSATDELSWRNMLDDDDIRVVEATYQVRAVSRRDGGQLHARVAQVVQLIRKNGKVDTKRRETRLTVLTEGPQGWREISSDKAP
jgi:serine/threonine protein kinase